MRAARRPAMIQGEVRGGLASGPRPRTGESLRRKSQGAGTGQKPALAAKRWPPRLAAAISSLSMCPLGADDHLSERR